jgi:hypothetical protein
MPPLPSVWLQQPYSEVSMKRHRAWTLLLLVLFLGYGCASTKISDRETYSGGPLPRPAHIIVYDFVTSPEDVAPDSAIAGQIAAPATPPTADQVEMEKQLGMQIAEELAADIREMGLSALRATSQTAPQVNDIMLRGYLLSVEQGSELKRVTLGFGSGASQLKTLVEGYQMTANGPRKLGQGSIDATGGKMPGGALDRRPAQDPLPGAGLDSVEAGMNWSSGGSSHRSPAKPPIIQPGCATRTLTISFRAFKLKPLSGSA